jgi:hypothetical protein
MRGQDFFIDLYENPDDCKEFLALLTESIVRYIRFLRVEDGQPEESDETAGLCDDFAALIPPDLFNDFVIPYWNAYYQGITRSGSRHLHCEGMRQPHLKKLEAAGISWFQPSVSPELDINMMVSNLSIEYDWMLPSFHLVNMSLIEIDRWVEKAVTAAEGSKLRLLRTQTNPVIVTQGKIFLVYRFLEAVGAVNNAGKTAT